MSYLKRTSAGSPFHPAAANYFNPEHSSAANSGFIDLNEVFSEAMQGYEIERSNKLFSIRFDHLPLALADKQQVLKVITDLLGMIVHHPPTGSSLFLYVKSTSPDTDCIDLSVPENSYSFCIHFFTNIVIDQQWLDLYHQKLEEISIIITTLKGRFACHKISSAGCLFSITLPGKLSS